ncbi:argininosuccinate lyase [Chryseobacterium sp. A301]
MNNSSEKAKVTKLWAKNSTKSKGLEIIEKFTLGKDPEFDLQLAKYDIIGTTAHVKMLSKIGYLEKQELSEILAHLEILLDRAVSGNFEIEPGVEDVHSQIELSLIQAVGAPGEKIHTGRSRNDQVLLAIKLFLREEAQGLAQATSSLFGTLISLSGKYEKELMPGYTHFQIGMPSSFGLWLSAFAESFSEDLEILATAYSIVSKNPLGSGAGYGSSFPLDRDYTTNELGLEKMNVNSIYAQMTRTKAEKTLAFAMASLASTLGKLANDLCLFSNQNFGFVEFPNDLTTGSSIMPHKKNPDVFELIRGKCSRIQALPTELTLLSHNLMTGYNRDYQLTKEILFPALEDLKDSIEIMEFMLGYMEVKKDLLDEKKYEYLFSVEKINELVLQGDSFREAYRKVGNSIENGTYHYEKKSLSHTHIGSIGNLSLERIVQDFNDVYKNFKDETS